MITLNQDHKAIKYSLNEGLPRHSIIHMLVCLRNLARMEVRRQRFAAFDQPGECSQSTSKAMNCFFPDILIYDVKEIIEKYIMGNLYKADPGNGLDEMIRILPLRKHQP